MREITYVKAFTESLMQLMAEDEDVVVIGEDVAHYGGVSTPSTACGRRTGTGGLSTLRSPRWGSAGWASGLPPAGCGRFAI